ncbi:MAG TPA: hypothetical protein VFA93_00600 [Patescibacteria group bacterium]|nr:hypothetical protein [Patescibacteria group bacterium]
MTIKETQVQTHVPDIDGEYHPVPVFYTDKLSAVDILDLSWSSHIGGYVPYLFVGLFREGPNSEWFFANARRHEDMKQAIEQDHGVKKDYTWGQLWFHAEGLSAGNLKFGMLTLNASTTPKEKELKQLIDSIDPRFVGDLFAIREASAGPSSWSWMLEKGKLKRRK